jgi:hypothetical protein
MESVSLPVRGLDRHPDIFRPLEAAQYLSFATERSLETLRMQYGLIGQKVGKNFRYHRADLDACALRMFGRERPPERIAGRSKS